MEDDNIIFKLEQQSQQISAHCCNLKTIFEMNSRKASFSRENAKANCYVSKLCGDLEEIYGHVLRCIFWTNQLMVEFWAKLDVWVLISFHYLPHRVSAVSLEKKQDKYYTNEASHSLGMFFEVRTCWVEKLTLFRNRCTDSLKPKWIGIRKQSTGNFIAEVSK